MGAPPVYHKTRIARSRTTSLASRDRGTAARVGRTLAHLETAFRRAVIRAQRAGEIDAARSPRAIARYLTSSAQGLSVMAKAFPERGILEDIANVILATLD